MNEILNTIFGAELYASLDSDVQAILCMFAFALVAWLVVRMFHALGGLI